MRSEAYRFELVPRDGSAPRPLTHVSDGRLTGNVNSEIRWSGSLTYHGTDLGLTDWFQYYVRPILMVGGARLEQAQHAYKTKTASLHGLFDDPIFMQGQGGVPQLNTNIERVNGHARTGEYVIRYTANGAGANVFGTYSPGPLPGIKTGHTYVAVMWVWCEPGVKWWFDFQQAQPDGSFRWSQIHVDSTATGQWERLITSPVTAPLGGLRFWCGLWSGTNTPENAGKHVWLDSLQIYDVTYEREEIRQAKQATREYPLGLYIPRPANPVVDTETGSSLTVNLYDRTFIPANDAVEQSFSVPKGSSLSAIVRGLLESSGEKTAITDMSITTRTDMVWEAGTTKIKIINDILAAAGFFSLHCDFHGAYHIDPYVPPASRPIAYRFAPSQTAIHLPKTAWEIDAKVPNKIICVSQETGDSPALVAVATNESPDSPYSFQNQGVWVTETHTGVEAATQQVLTQIAQRYLSTAASSATVERHMLATPLALNSLVLSQTGGREVVENIDIDFTPGELMKIITREVA